MVKNKIAALLAISLLAATPAVAQRAIIAGENPALDGTYCNIMANPATSSTITLASTPCALFVTAFMRMNGPSGLVVTNSGSANPSGQGGSSLSVQSYQGGLLVGNISTNTALTSAAARLFKVSVITAGTTPGAVHNIGTTGGAAAANQVATIPNVVGVYDYNFPMLSGIVYIAGTGQVVAISYQ